LALVAATVVLVIGLYKMNTSPYSYTYAIPGIPNTGPQTQELAARGQKLALLCTGCHAAAEGQFPLSGSKDNFVAGGPPIGVLYAPNLTPGGPLKDWTDAQVARAIREGVDKDGRPLIIMPSQVFHNMSDKDVQAVITFLRSQPAVDRSVPPKNLNLLAAFFFGTGLFPTSAQPPLTQPVNAPQAGTPAHGKYLVDISGCRDCHGENLTGSSGGFGPAGPSIATLVPQWSEGEFLNTIRTGVDPAGHQLNPDNMPWKVYSAMYSDQELADIYQYLHTLPPGK
jgi:cytochrome c553